MRRFSNLFKASYAVAVSLLLAGCTSIPVSSMLALSRIDFSTTDISALRVAVELPNAIEAAPGGVHMEIGYTLGSKADKMVFRLAEDEAQVGQRGLLPLPVEGKHIHAYRLREKDVETLNRLRTDTLAAKKDGEKGSLSFGISAREFCRTGRLAEDKLEITTFVASSETKGYVVLVRDFDLRSDQQINASLVNMPACGK